MAFDPDAFLSGKPAKGGFDVDAFLGTPKQKTAEPPAFKLNSYTKEDETKLGPLSQDQQNADWRLERDPLAEGDVSLDAPRSPREAQDLRRWQRLTGNTPEDNVERERQQQARGFAGFAVSQLSGGLVGGGLRAIGAGPAVSAIGAGAASGAAPTLIAGGTPTEVLKDAAIGAAIPAVGAGITGAARGILASHGAKARARIEAAGGKVGVRDSGSGLPEFEGRGKVTDADIGEASRTAGEKLIAANDKRFDLEGRQPYRAGAGEISKGQGRNLVSIIPIRREMNTVADDPSTNPATAAFLRRQVAEMDAQFPMDSGRQYAPESWVNGKTSMLMDMANVGKSRPGDATPRDAKIASVASVGQKIREAGPYADVNKAYAKAINESGDFRQALGLNRSPSANEAVDEKKAANMLARRGHTTTTAGVQRKESQRLEEILSANPELARIAESPELLSAKADLQFRAGNPSHGGTLERLGIPGGGILGAMAGAELGGAHGGVKGAALGLATGLAVQNANPIAGRLLYTPARGAVPVGEAISGAGGLAAQYSAMKNNPIIQAYLEAQRRNEERAKSLHAKDQNVGTH